MKVFQNRAASVYKKVGGYSTECLGGIVPNARKATEYLL